LASIACEVLADPTLNALLIVHLRTADLFGVAHHPRRSSSPTQSKIARCTDGTPNHLLRGTFTLRGISRALGLPSPSGDAIWAADDRLWFRSIPMLVATTEDGRASPARQFES